LVKKRRDKPRREVTKRQLSRWQQQRRRQRIIFGSGIFIIIAALGVIGGGWFVSQYQPLHQTVIKVNDAEFDMNYYIKMLKYYGEGLPAQYMQFMVDEAVTAIEQNELVRQEAEKLGISVSNDAVDEELKSRDPPLSKDYRDIIRAELLIKKLRDEYFEQKVPVSDEQRHIMAMFLESEKQASEIRAKLENDERFVDLAKELSLDSFSKEKEGDLDWRPKGILDELLTTSVVEEYAFSSDVGVLSQPIYDEDKTKMVGYWIIKVLDRKEEPEEAHVQAILLGSEEEAQGVRIRLEDGEDFADLAEELSQHRASKEDEGELTGLTPGMMSPAFDEFIFHPELRLRLLGEPVRDDAVVTNGGYWLIKVVDIDYNREIEEEDRDLLKSKALTEWVSSLRDDPENKVESYLDEEKKGWAILQATGG